MFLLRLSLIFRYLHLVSYVQNQVNAVLQEGPFLPKDFLSKFPGWGFAQFFVFPYFHFFFPKYWMRSLPNILPSVKFHTLEMFLFFLLFLFFLEKKKKKIWEKVAR